MSFADMAVMETFKLLNKVRTEGPKERPERIEPPRYMNNKPKPPKEPKQPKTDPLRVLDPGRKKLTTVESQRILAVLDDSIKKAEIVTLLPYVLENMDRFSVVLGTEMVSALQEHTNIQNSFADLQEKILMQRSSQQQADVDRTGSVSRTSQQQRDTPLSQRSRAFSRQSTGSQRESMGSAMSGRDEMQDVEPDEPAEPHISEEEEQDIRTLNYLQNQMKFSIKNLLRLLSLNPAAVNAVRTERQERDQEAGVMITYTNELRGFILERLLTTPLEEKQKTDYLEQITIRERKNSEVIKKLSAELKTAEDDKDLEISKRNDEIRRLKADLHQIEKFSEEHIRRTKSEADKQQQADTKNSEGKQAKLQTEFQALKTQLANNTAEHRESELALRKRKYKIETEVENWILKFDLDMGERQAEYEDLDAIYTEEKAQLNELEERFKTLETEYTTIVEERRIAREKRDREDRELAVMIKAATVVQSFWRSYKCRKALKSKKKKKGKGKGKKGKKR